MTALEETARCYGPGPQQIRCRTRFAPPIQKMSKKEWAGHSTTRAWAALLYTPKHMKISAATRRGDGAFPISNLAKLLASTFFRRRIALEKRYTPCRAGSLPPQAFRPSAGRACSRARSLGSFWAALLAGRTLVTACSPDRRDRSTVDLEKRSSHTAPAPATI